MRLGAAGLIDAGQSPCTLPTTQNAALCCPALPTTLPPPVPQQASVPLPHHPLSADLRALGWTGRPQQRPAGAAAPSPAALWGWSAPAPAAPGTERREGRGRERTQEGQSVGASSGLSGAIRQQPAGSMHANASRKTRLHPPSPPLHNTKPNSPLRAAPRPAPPRPAPPRPAPPRPAPPRHCAHLVQQRKSVLLRDAVLRHQLGQQLRLARPRPSGDLEDSQARAGGPGSALLPVTLHAAAATGPTLCRRLRLGRAGSLGGAGSCPRLRGCRLLVKLKVQDKGDLQGRVAGSGSAQAVAALVPKGRSSNRGS